MQRAESNLYSEDWMWSVFLKNTGGSARDMFFQPLNSLSLWGVFACHLIWGSLILKISGSGKISESRECNHKSKCFFQRKYMKKNCSTYEHSECVSVNRYSSFPFCATWENMSISAHLSLSVSDSIVLEIFASSFAPTISTDFRPGVLLQLSHILCSLIP